MISINKWGIIPQMLEIYSTATALKKSVLSFSQPSVNPAMQIKDDSFNPAQAQQFPGDLAYIFLLRNLMIGQINTQQATVDQVVK